jgi:CopG family nickel-responsive transcriptional regulator
MQRVTISLEESLAEEFDALRVGQAYQSRSEAIRDIVRQAVEKERQASLESGRCVACLSYVYDHHVREMAQRLIELQHNHHDIVVSTTHVHLDHDTCLETAILKGSISVVRALADAIKSERGVRFAHINLISVKADSHVHAEGGEHSHDPELHFTPHAG